MKLYYWREHPNFGDALNAWLWPQLLDGILDDDEQALLVGIGTLLRSDMPRRPRMAVFGTGAGYGEHPRIDPSWTIYCVRGPLTAQALGLPPSAAITDGAALLRLLDLAAQPKHYPVAFMPHWESTQFWDWAAVCRAAGVQYLDPFAAPEDMLAMLGRSELVVTEAMHGAIVADALRIPWIAVRSAGQILPFKWHDWCSSLGLSYRPVDIPSLYDEPTFRSVLPKRLRSRLPIPAEPGSLAGRALDTLGVAAGRLSRPLYRRKAKQITALLATLPSTHAPQLSSDQAISSATARLAEQLERFKADARAGRFSAPAIPHARMEGLGDMQLEGVHFQP